jgi:hypothetical protein
MLSGGSSSHPCSHDTIRDTEWQVKVRRIRRPTVERLRQGQGGQAAQFLDFLVAGDPGPLVDPAAALRSRNLQGVNDRPIVADRQLQRLDGMRVNPAPFDDFITRGLECGRGTLQGGIGSNGEAPIAVKLGGGASAQVALHDVEQAGDLVGAGLMRANPAVLLPVVKTHARLR